MPNISTITGNVLGDSGIDASTIPVASGTSSQLLAGNGSLISAGSGITISGGTISASGGSGSGSVTSVAASVPTGFTITGSPITTAGTLAISFDTGYSLPTTATQTNWDTAYTNRITSLTTTGSSGAATLISNVLNIPQYTLAGLGGVSSNIYSADGSLASNRAITLNAFYLRNVGSVFTSQTHATGRVTIGGTTEDSNYLLDVQGRVNAMGLNLSANTSTMAALDFDPTSAVLKTSSIAGDMEVDANGLLYYSHNNSNRGVVNVEQFISLTSTYTLTSQTGAQKLFNSTTNGALSVKGSTSYFFECFYTLTSMSGSSGNGGFSVLGAGTATVTSSAFWATGLDNTTLTTGAAIGGSFTASATTTNNITTAATGTAVAVLIRGIIRINAGGTIIPSVSLTTAAAAVVGVNSYFRIYPIGTNTTTNVGNWS